MFYTAKFYTVAVFWLCVLTPRPSHDEISYVLIVSAHSSSAVYFI